MVDELNNADAALEATLNVEETISDEELNAIPVPEPEVEPVKEEPKQDPLEKRNELNIRELRKRAESAAKAERERDEALQRIADMERERLLKSVQAQQQQQPAEDLHIAPDALAEGKHIDAVTRQLRELDQKLEQYQKVNLELTVHSRLKQELPDIDQVVTRDNIDRLRDSYPELAETLKDTKDLYSKGVAAYTLLKKFGIYQDDEVVREKVRIMKNIEKPKPSNAAVKASGDSPLSYVDGFRMEDITDEMRAKLMADMAKHL
jgi:hypothetical protein